MTEPSQHPTAIHPTPYPESGGGSGTSMKEKAGNAAETAKQAGSEVAATATDRAKDVAAETKRQARDLMGEARGQVNEQVGTQHRNLVNNMRSLGDELRGMSTSSQQSGVATELVAQVGDRAHGVADWLDNREPGQLLDEVRAFARRRPGVFLAGALVAGVAVGRLTRGVVATHTEDSRTAQPTTPAPTGQRPSTPASSAAPPAPTTSEVPPLPATDAYASGYESTSSSRATGYNSPSTGSGLTEPAPEGLLPGTPPGFGEQR
jgi:hypothetical protein